MKPFFLCLTIAFLCCVSFLAGRRSTAEAQFAAHAVHETNELDQMQSDVAGQK